MTTVLLVDDDDLLRNLVSRRLRKQGYEVIEAHDGRVAIERFQTAAVDAVVTDVVMPEQEGIETIQRLRELAPAIPIVAMSGGVRGSDHVLKVASHLGASRTLAKPFRINQLLTILQSLLSAPAPAAARTD